MHSPLGSHLIQDNDSASALLDPSSPIDPFQRLKACSVVAYSEATLQRLPWSGLHPTNRPGMLRLKLEEQEQSRSIRWIVTSPGEGLPGSFERAIFRALEWIAIEGSILQGLPFTNPLLVHPRDICERLCCRVTHPVFAAIEKGIRNLCRIEIANVRPGSRPRTRRFGLLRSVTLRSGSSVERGKPFPELVIHFDEFFVDSVNAGRIRPMNWALWTALRDPLARRMLEVIESEFGTPRATASATLDSDMLALLLPLDPTLPRARRQALFQQAHDALLKKGYLGQVYCRSRGGSEVFFYQPGPTYHALRYRLERQPQPHSCRRLLREVWTYDDRPDRFQRKAQG